MTVGRVDINNSFLYIPDIQTHSVRLFFFFKFPKLLVSINIHEHFQGIRMFS